nr:DUF4125 family protein [Oscillospiraceae bacterium]
GYTHAYARVLESMINLEVISYEEFKGINLSEQYYETFGKPMIKEKFSDYEDKIAVGLVGEGSDCYGFDDKVSRDHDFGCGFCMWLTDDVYNQIGEHLENAYNKLPEYFRGIPKLKIRRGVYKISDFIENLTGLKNFPENTKQWLDVPEYALSVITNGKIFTDKSGVFSALREKYNYYPDNIRNIKLAESLAKASQSGQYNYARAMSRNDILTAKLHINDFADNIINIAFILNRKYMPHRKWQTKFIKSFSILSGLYDDITELLLKEPDSEKWSKYLPEEWYGRINYDDFHVCLIEKICSEISSILSSIFSIPKKNYLEFCAEEIFKLNSKENIIENIINTEWKMFDKVQNTDGRASCQDDFETFYIMRKSQYMTWNENLLQSYLNDLYDAEKSLRNLISEKYARMMEYTSPAEYAEIAEKLPAMSNEQCNIINQIAEIQAGWFEEFSEKYPKLANNARDIHSYEDNIYNTSYETYLKGELSVYSPKTLELYGRFIVNLYNSNKNLAEMTIKNTVILYGYANLDDAENKM